MTVWRGAVLLGLLAGLGAGTAAACPGCRAAAAEAADGAGSFGNPPARREVANVVIAAGALVPLASAGAMARAFRVTAAR